MKYIKTMTIMTRSMCIDAAHTYNTLQNINELTIKQTNAFNHYKRWHCDDNDKLENIAKKSIISPNDIQELANQLGRSYGSVKTRILTFYLKNDFDYKTCDNDKLLDKYKFATMEDIEYYALKGFSIKAKLNYRLNKITNIVSKIKDRDNCAKITDTVKYIQEENNLLSI